MDVFPEEPKPSCKSSMDQLMFIKWRRGKSILGAVSAKAWNVTYLGNKRVFYGLNKECVCYWWEEVGV